MNFKKLAAYLLWILLLGAPSLYFKIDNRDFYLDGWIESDYNWLVWVAIVISLILGVMNCYVK